MAAFESATSKSAQQRWDKVTEFTSLDEIRMILEQRMPLALNFKGITPPKKGKETLTLKVQLKDPQLHSEFGNAEAFHMELDWDRPTKTMRVSDYVCGKPYENNHIGAISLGNIIALTRRMGGERIELTAGNENGGYFWVRSGAYIDKTGHKNDANYAYTSKPVFENLHTRLNEVLDNLRDTSLAAKLHRKFAERLLKQDQSALQEIASDKTPVVFYGVGTTIGQAVFMNPNHQTKYCAHFDLTDDKQMERVQSYLDHQATPGFAERYVSKPQLAKIREKLAGELGYFATDLPVHDTPERNQEEWCKRLADTHASELGTDPFYRPSPKR